MTETSGKRPQRWDKPFGAEALSDAAIDRVLAIPAFADVKAEDFPASLSLREIIANDARIRRFSRGDIIFRKGDYGNSVFLLIEGSVRGLASESAEKAVTPREEVSKRSWFDSLAQLWRNSKIPEFRSSVRYAAPKSPGRKPVRLFVDRSLVVSSGYVGLDRRRSLEAAGEDGIVHAGSYEGPDRRQARWGGAESIVTRLEGVDDIIEEYPTFTVAAPSVFGEIAALSRSPRTATIFADGDVEAVELRWQGLRDIRRWSDGFRTRIDALYRERGLLAHLAAAPIFSRLDEQTLRIIADQTLFETYGDFEWTQSFQRVRSASARMDRMIEHEPVIAEEGHYLDGLLLVRWGFARVSRRVDHGEETVDYLTANDSFGLEDIVAASRGQGSGRLSHSLRAIGYVDVLRVPTRLIEEYVLPTLPRNTPAPAAAPALDGGAEREPLIDFLVDNRIINGTKTMVIDTNRCVNCDDCVRACASTHDGNPRFVRHGPSHRNVMIANACMHCVDPVCLIGCPTGAIHRSAETGSVIIDDITCIGCATCANSCPYHNIRMVETRNAAGAFIVDDDMVPIAKATKCDLCAGQLGGPACQRACPHDALVRIDIRDMRSLARWLEH